MKTNSYTPQSIWVNPRFYVLCASLFGSVAVAAYILYIVPTTELAVDRIHTVYGYIAIALLYIALSIGAIHATIASRKFSFQLVLYSRRAIGVSVTYFAFMHLLLAYFGKLGGLDSIAYLPAEFLISLLLGSLALIILILLAATSFDRMIQGLGYGVWKFIHRFVYVAALLIIIHAWMIGTYVAETWVLLASFVLIVPLLILESLRLTKYISRRFVFLQRRDLTIATWLAIVVMLLTMLIAIYSIRDTYHHDASTTKEYNGSSTH